MDPQLAEATIKTYLNEIRSRLDKAAGIGRAADACVLPLARWFPSVHTATPRR
jgi:hypothetical protein